MKLILVDTAIVICVWQFLILLSNATIGSLLIEGSFTSEKILCFYLCIMAMRLLLCVYNSIWRYANVDAYLRLMFADFFGGAIYYLLTRYAFHDLAIGFAYSLITTFLIQSITQFSRTVYQYLYAAIGRNGKSALARNLFGKNEGKHHRLNIAIVGAGNVGAALAEELKRNPAAYYNPICFVDKDIQKVGKTIMGLRIYQEDDQIVKRLQKLPIHEIVIALPEADKDDRARLYELYVQTGYKVKLYDYPLGDKGGVHQEEDSQRTLRDFAIEDVLFRDPIKVNNHDAMRRYTGKTILVTGGGGSIGSELCRQLAELSPAKLIILDIYENNAYEIQQELVRRYGSALNLRTVIASVRDVKRLEEIFQEEHPQIVFHAAAHKHVPLMEEAGCEAIKNNVFGTYHMANLAEKYGVEKFILISTDKAVNPTNIMGASKRLCEMIVRCRQDSRTCFTAVRFGNVLGSNGSVIPLFKRQIAAGGPITLTDKRIIRYFMTIPEAVGLVMEAGITAKSNELFVLNMGKPIRILDLAENMIRLSGLTPYKDIDIVEIGLRPGEKLYEELLMKTEHLDKTENEMIFTEQEAAFSREEVEEKLQLLAQAIRKEEPGASIQGYREAVLRAIRETVPTFHSPEEVNREAEKSEEMKMVGEGDAS